MSFRDDRCLMTLLQSSIKVFDFLGKICHQFPNGPFEIPQTEFGDHCALLRENEIQFLQLDQKVQNAVHEHTVFNSLKSCWKQYWVRTPISAINTGDHRPGGVHHIPGAYCYNTERKSSSLEGPYASSPGPPIARLAGKGYRPPLMTTRGGGRQFAPRGGKRASGRLQGRSKQRHLNGLHWSCWRAPRETVGHR